MLHLIFGPEVFLFLFFYFLVSSTGNSLYAGLMPGLRKRKDRILRAFLQEVIVFGPRK